MSLEITFSKKELQKEVSKLFLNRAYKLCLKSLRATPEFEKVKKLVGVPKYAEIYFCYDQEMRAYQKKFRNLDRTTDVLSFPSLESPNHVQNGFLGSLIVSIPSVKRNAKRYKRTYQRELYEVFVHGVLHLFGFDHVRVSHKKKQRMRSMQKKIFSEVYRVLKL